MDIVALFIQVTYFVCVVGLACYGLHMLWLSGLTLRHRPAPPRRHLKPP